MACGDAIFGWETECMALGQVSYEDPLEPGMLLEIDPFEGPTTACCEGSPSHADADAECEQACVRQLCNVAEDIYDSIAEENDWHCTLGCRFDYEGCLAGVPVQQFPQRPFGYDYPHEVTVACNASNVEPRQPGGTFAFIDSPHNFGYNDPGSCGEPPEMSGLEPLRDLVANRAHDDASTHAIASWTSTDSGGRLDSSDIAATIEYDLRSCGITECIELTGLRASVPPGYYGGLEVQSAEVMLISAAEIPAVDASGHFEFEPGSLNFVLRSDVGGVPLAIVRTNSAPTLGRVRRASDLFELTGLKFDLEDSGFGAGLQLDIVASHTNRAPQAAIRRLDTPTSCQAPVAFGVASVDLDDDPMQHYWWFPGGMAKASSTEIALPPGEHLIVLVSIDQHGAHDATSLVVRRSCQ